MRDSNKNTIRLKIKYEMGSHQLITVPDYNWITITSNNSLGVVLKQLQCVIEQNGGHVMVCLIRCCCFRWRIFLLLAFEVSFAFLLASKSSIAVNNMAAVR